MTFASRVVIIGNGGSGKSTLAHAIGQRGGAPVFDLDDFHWQDGYGFKRAEPIARQLVADAAAAPAWIIEGVFGWLAEVALPRASALIWLDVPWSVCCDGLSARGPRGASAADHAALLEWAEAYWRRTTSSSFSGHLTLFAGFDRVKQRFTSRSEAEEFLVNNPRLFAIDV
jgi:adenylate kinase family enzyme